MLEKLKSVFKEDAYFYATLLLLVAIISFGLGRVSIKAPETASNQPLNEAKVVQPLVQNREVTASKTTSGQVVVGSKSGSRYHLPTCPGAKQIKDNNLVQFDSIQSAEAAGYTPAANCKF